jgi:hypothetical protein
VNIPSGDFMTFLSSGERGRRHALRTMYLLTRTM